MATNLTPIWDIIPMSDQIFIENLNFNQRIGSLNIFSGGFVSGSGDSVFGLDANGIRLGGADFATAPFSVTMAGVVTASAITLTGGTFKFGKTSFTDTVNAGYHISSSGFYFGSADDAKYIKYTISTGAFVIKGAIDNNATIGGRLASVLAAAIDASGHFADAAIDTANAQILSDFTFGASGAIQIGEYESGVTGDIKISPTGILGRDKDNNTTFSLNATTGVAILNGLVVGTNVGIGTAEDSDGVTTIIGNIVTTGYINAKEITAKYVSASISISSPIITGGTITGSILQTATSGKRIRILVDAGSTPTQLANSFALIDTSNNILLSIGSSGAAIQEITPVDNTVGLNIINKTGVDYGSDLLFLKIVEAGSTGECLDIENAGTGHCIRLTNTGTGGHLEFIPKASFTSALSEGLCYANTDNKIYYYNSSEWLSMVEQDGTLATLTAGETISNTQALMVAKAGTGYKPLLQYSNDTSDINFGKASGNYDKCGEEFRSQDLNIASSSGLWINRIQVRLKKIGSPTDNVKVSLQGDITGAPDGTPLVSAILSGTSITTSYVDYNFDVGYIDLTAATDYHIVLERDGASSDSDYYAISQGVDGLANASTDLLPVGGGWGGSINDLNFIIKQHYFEGNIYIASARAGINLYESFIGFAIESIVAETITNSYRIAGKVAIAGLTAGEKYYLSDTFGIIDTSAGTNSKSVGMALSTTQLQILNVV